MGHNIVICVVLFAILMGTPFCWGDALVSAGAIILGAMIIGVLLIIGSSIVGFCWGVEGYFNWLYLAIVSGMIYSTTNNFILYKAKKAYDAENS